MQKSQNSDPKTPNMKTLQTIFLISCCLNLSLFTKSSFGVTSGERPAYTDYTNAVAIGTWCGKARGERWQAIGTSGASLPKVNSQKTIVQDLKSSFQSMSSSFVNQSSAVGGAFDAWFATSNAYGRYQDSFPAWSSIEILSYVSAPTNYLINTPWLATIGSGTNSSYTYGSYLTSDYGWKNLSNLYSALRWTSPGTVLADVQNMTCSTFGLGKTCAEQMSYIAANWPLYQPGPYGGYGNTRVAHKAYDYGSPQTYMEPEINKRKYRVVNPSSTLGPDVDFYVQARASRYNWSVSPFSGWSPQPPNVTSSFSGGATYYISSFWKTLTASLSAGANYTTGWFAIFFDDTCPNNVYGIDCSDTQGFVFEDVSPLALFRWDVSGGFQYK